MSSNSDSAMLPSFLDNTAGGSCLPPAPLYLVLELDPRRQAYIHVIAIRSRGLYPDHGFEEGMGGGRTGGGWGEGEGVWCNPRLAGSWTSDIDRAHYQPYVVAILPQNATTGCHTPRLFSLALVHRGVYPSSHLTQTLQGPPRWSRSRRGTGKVTPQCHRRCRHHHSAHQESSLSRRCDARVPSPLGRLALPMPNSCRALLVEPVGTNSPTAQQPRC